MRRLRFALLLLAACPGPRAPAPPASAPASAPAVAACPAPEVLAARLRGEWDLAPEEQLEVSCAAGRFDGPALYVGATARGARFLVGDGVLRADLSTWLVAPEVEEVPEEAVYDTEALPEAADLDGDGRDELLITFASTIHGIDESHVMFFAVRGGALVTIGDLPLSSSENEPGDDDEGAPEVSALCEARGELRREGPRLVYVVTVTRVEGDASACLAPGEHRFGLVDGQVKAL